MRFSFTPDQDLLRTEARRFLAERVDVRAQMTLPGAHSESLWQEMAKLGWLGVVAPEEYGGMGLGHVEMAVLFEEAGRALLPGPFASSVVHGILPVLLCGDDRQRSAMIPPLLSGEVAVGCEGATLVVDGDVLRGDVDLVVGAGVADRLVVVAPDGRVWVLARDAFSAEPVETADITRPCYRVRIEGTGELLSRALPPSHRIVAHVAASAEMIGSAATCVDMAVAYANERVQFDRPIGSFQAIKHKAADMMRALEGARLATYYAAWALDAGSDDAGVASSVALVAATDAFMLCAAENIQIHGGIGVTWEHDAHLYYRRALAFRAAYGSPSTHRDRVAHALLDGTALTERA